MNSNFLLFIQNYLNILNMKKCCFVNRSGSRGVTSDDGHITIKILADTDRSRGSSNIYILEVGDSPLNPNPGGNGQKRPTFFFILNLSAFCEINLKFKIIYA
jgi:hypothetical protein